MTFKHYFKTAATSLRMNASRSFLTILGIVIGIAAIMLISSVGQSAEGLIVRELQGMGTDTVVVLPGREPRGPTDIAETLFSDSLKEREVEALRRRGAAAGIVEVAPLVIVPGTPSHDGSAYRRAFVLGAPVEFLARTFQIRSTRGTLYDDIDIRQRASVAVIGINVARELFGNEDPVGKQIRIKDRAFRVIGAFPPHGQVAFFNIDDTVIIPYTTAQSYLLGFDHYHRIIVQADPSFPLDHVVREVEITLRELHNITDPNDDDFFVVTQEGMAAQIGTIVNVFTIFLAFVVAVALVVGGIGVMNIMLVSVTERTREIGLRKAVGATEKNILTQFLYEAVFLTFLGGLFGIALGLAMSLGAAYILSAIVGLQWQFAVPMRAIIISLAAAALVGIAFGIYPAKQAAKKNPIDALRYE